MGGQKEAGHYLKKKLKGQRDRNFIEFQADRACLAYNLLNGKITSRGGRFC